MREIKFRAWDLKKEKMIDWKELVDFCDVDYLFGYIREYEKEDRFNYPIPMQYTGI